MIKQANINGLNLNYLYNDKFKNTLMMIRITGQVNKETATKRALVTKYLNYATKSYPSLALLASELDNLYGMSLSNIVGNKGSISQITYLSKCIEEDYLIEKEMLLNKQFALVAEMILDPITKNNGFDEKIVAVCKKELKDYFALLYDDKYSYAIHQALNHYLEESLINVDSMGYPEEIDDISCQDLYDYYQEMIKTNQFDLFISSSQSFERIKELTKTYFNQPFKQLSLNPIYPYHHQKANQEIVEYQDLSQSKLVIAYSTNKTILDDDYYPFLIASNILGGFMHSKLFRYVREKHSLCYRIYNQYDPLSGVMIVVVGIEKAKYNQACMLIDQQVAAIKLGDISDEEFEVTKIMMIDQILKVKDSQASLLNFVSSRQLINQSLDIHEIIDKLNQVTLDQVQASFKAVNKQLTYFLTKEHDNE